MMETITVKRLDWLCMATAALALAGCEGMAAKKPVAVAPAPVSKSAAWKAIASEADQDRISNVTGAWAAGLSAAQRNFGSAIRDEGALLKENAALARPDPTPGSYRCRVISLGATAKGKPAFERFKPFFCYVQVENDLLTIVKQTGSQRPAGRLWADDNPKRLVFLGSLALGNEDEVLAYGDDRKRDMAGIFERVGPFRWRLVIPWPQDGAKLQVFELTPVADQPE